MPRNLYVDVDAWEREFSHDVDLAVANRLELEHMLESASRDVDTFCRRFFYAKIETVIFDGTGSALLTVPDLLAVTTIKFDEDRDRTFETTLVAADFYLARPHAALPYDMFPKTCVILDGLNGSFSRFAAQEKLVEIAAEWGYGNDVVDTDDTVQDAVEQDATQKTLLVENGALFSVGHTLRIGTEQEYVTGVAGTTVSVARGVNGTTAATHANGLQIDRYVYTPEVRQATLIQSARLWKRKEVAFIDREPPSKFGNFDTDAARELQDFVRYD